MALNFGSGRILGDNDWVNGNGNTWDGFLVGINNDFADLHVGYAATDDMVDMYDMLQQCMLILLKIWALWLSIFYMLTKSDDGLVQMKLQWVLMQLMRWTTVLTYL